MLLQYYLCGHYHFRKPFPGLFQSWHQRYSSLVPYLFGLYVNFELNNSCERAHCFVNIKVHAQGKYPKFVQKVIYYFSYSKKRAMTRLTSMNVICIIRSMQILIPNLKGMGSNFYTRRKWIVN